MEKHIDGRPLVAHNAGFDIGIVNHFRQRATRRFAAEHYACTLEMAQALMPGLDNHKLDTLTELFGIDLNHHEAASDAVACATLAMLFDRIAMPDGLASYLRSICDCGGQSNGRGYIDVQVNGSSERMRRNGHSTLCKKCGCDVPMGAGILQRVRGKWIVECRKCFTPIQQVIVAAPDGRFNGLKFIFTGDFNLISREEAEKHAADQGAHVTDSVSKLSDYVVISDDELARYKREGSATRKVDKAHELVAEGRKLKILTEAEYLDIIK
jgi:DNA polymerase III subunit epsilon